MKFLNTLVLTLYFLNFYTTTQAKTNIQLGCDFGLFIHPLAKEVFSEISRQSKILTISLNDTKLSEILPEVNTGKLDGDCGRIKTIKDFFPKSDVENLIVVDEPVYTLFIYLAYRVGEKIPLEFKNLKDYPITFLRGIKLLESALNSKTSRPVANHNEGISLVKRGRYNAHVLFGLVSKNPSPQKTFQNLTITEKPILELPIHMVLNKKLSRFVPELNEVIGRMRSSNWKAESIENFPFPVLEFH